MPGVFPNRPPVSLLSSASGPLGHLPTVGPGWTLIQLSLTMRRKEVMIMTLPGIVTGRPTGHQVGQAIFQFLPCLPLEGPPGMPRVLAKALFPGGFVPGKFPAAPAAPPAPVVQPPVPVQPPAPPANQAPPAAPAQPPQPAPRGYRPAISGSGPIGGTSQRIQIHERPGL